MNTANPWNLTEREAQMLDLWAIHGSQCEAARLLEIDRNTVTTLIARATSKMAAKHNVHALLMWDRFAYGRGETA